MCRIIVCLDRGVLRAVSYQSCNASLLRCDVERNCRRCLRIAADGAAFFAHLADAVVRQQTARDYGVSARAEIAPPRAYNDGHLASCTIQRGFPMSMHSRWRRTIAKVQRGLQEFNFRQAHKWFRLVDAPFSRLGNQLDCLIGLPNSMTQYHGGT